MPIEQSDFKFRPAAAVNDTGSNGGRMGDSEIADNVKNNVWPDVAQSERTAGSTKYRKVFCHVANDDDITLTDVKLFVENYTPGEDSITIFAATQEDTQASVTGSERQYGAGQLDATVSAGVTSIDVLTEGVALGVFVNGDTIRISDKTDIDAAGSAEYLTINAAVTYSGDVATISFTPALSNGYAAAATRVASILDHADVVASVSAWVESSVGSGTYDETTYPLVMDHIGSVRQAWTLTFTSATAFGVVGDTLGSVGTGDTSGPDFSPNNPVRSNPYFTLAFAGWAGTWANGDTITFTTDAAAAVAWEKRIIPAGAASLSGNSAVLAIDGAGS